MVEYKDRSDLQSAVSAYGKRLLKAVKEMYVTIHQRESLTKMSWKRRMNKHRKAIEKAASFRVPEQKEAQNLSERMKGWGGSYFTFIAKEIPSTNNAADQAIRAIVLDRKVTQGSRSEWGNRWYGTILEHIGNLHATGKTGYVSAIEMSASVFVPSDLWSYRTLI
ncbi:MAG: transposase [Spirochaetaceae bacterium]|nr:transposase [Spirochaetaceae bacterium]